VAPGENGNGSLFADGSQEYMPDIVRENPQKPCGKYVPQKSPCAGQAQGLVEGPFAALPRFSRGDGRRTSPAFLCGEDV